MCEDTNKGPHPKKGIKETMAIIDSLKYVSYAYCFYPGKLRAAAIEAKERHRRSRQSQLDHVEVALSEEEGELLDRYWYYDQALVDGGYTLERLRVCHGADVTVDGEVLKKYSETFEEKEGYDTIRNLYVKDVNHVRGGGLLSQLGREYCREYCPTTDGRLRKDHEMMLAPRISAQRIARYMEDPEFTEYIDRMAGVPYDRLWPDARLYLAESWEWDKRLLAEKEGSGSNYRCGCYSYERLKVCRSHEFIFFRCLHPGMFPMFTKHDNIEEILKAERNLYKASRGSLVIDDYVLDFQTCVRENNRGGGEAEGSGPEHIDQIPTNSTGGNGKRKAEKSPVGSEAKKSKTGR